MSDEHGQQPIPPKPPLPGQPTPPPPGGDPAAAPQTAGQPFPPSAHNPYAPSAAYPGQPYAGQPYAGQPYAGQPAAGQPAPGQPYAGQPYAGQPAPGQPYPGHAGVGYAAPPAGGKKKSPALILGLVAGGVVLLAIIGTLIAIFTSPAAQETARPAPPVPTDQPAAPTDPDEDDPVAPSQPSGDAVAFGDCEIVPVQGWTFHADGSEWAYGESGNGELVEAGCVAFEADTDPGFVLQSYFGVLAEDTCTESEVLSEPAEVDAGIDGLAVGSGVLGCRVSNANGTFDVAILALSGTRDDGRTVITGLYLLEGSDQERLQQDFSAMTQSAWVDLLGG